MLAVAVAGAGSTNRATGRCTIAVGQNLTLLERLDDPATRIWYAEQVIAHGWSRPILAMNIQRQLHKRTGRAVNNFNAMLPPPDSDLAAQVFKDPCLFDFLGTADPRREHEVEDPGSGRWRCASPAERRCRRIASARRL